MIPIYRAKKIDSDEWVEGYVVISGENDIDYYICPFLGYQEQIDPNTLAIHFPNMIDKNGKKIFASLNEDGVGGDKFMFDGKEYIYRFGEYGLETIVDIEWIDRPMAFNYHLVEVIGIHKGE